MHWSSFHIPISHTGSERRHAAWYLRMLNPAAPMIIYQQHLAAPKSQDSEPNRSGKRMVPNDITMTLTGLHLLYLQGMFS